MSYLYNGIICKNENEQTKIIATFSNMARSLKQNIEWKKGNKNTYTMILYIKSPGRLN